MGSEVPAPFQQSRLRQLDCTQQAVIGGNAFGA